MKNENQLVRKWIEAPLPEAADNDGDTGLFDPWDDLGLYGNYSSDFDDLAIAVLEDMLNGTSAEKGLPERMFRELLCFKGLCDYGTSPRCCWPVREFREALPTIIEKWKALRDLRWA